MRDDDSGLRHDGEPVTSPDGDLRHINPDGDPSLESEPLSMDPGTAVDSNGAAEDIDVDVADNDSNSLAPDYRDISASGTWRMAASRAGVAYAFTASGADRRDGELPLPGDGARPRGQRDRDGRGQPDERTSSRTSSAWTTRTRTCW